MAADAAGADRLEEIVMTAGPGDGTARGTAAGAAGGWPDAVVVAPDGTATAPDGRDPGGVDDDPDGDPARQLVDMVEQPAKVMRIGSMIKQLLEEVKSAPLDEASRRRLREIHGSSVAELKQGLAPELVAELDRLSLPFGPDEVPSEAELRIAQAQLVGWLEGLFHGIQTALFAQQMAARQQLEQMRRALPAGPSAGPPAGAAAPDGRPGPDRGHEPGGLYL